jgi:isoprenylcysteine carboxyl methyltransferase (ICMT) family protein YpbQ
LYLSRLCFFLLAFLLHILPFLPCSFACFSIIFSIYMSSTLYRLSCSLLTRMFIISLYTRLLVAIYIYIHTFCTRVLSVRSTLTPETYSPRKILHPNYFTSLLSDLHFVPSIANTWHARPASPLAS